MLRIDEDQIHDTDREFFAKNPGRRLYVRRVIGHLEKQNGANATAVIKVGNVRIRAPLQIPRLNNRLLRRVNEKEEVGMIDAFCKTYPEIGGMLRSAPSWRENMH